MKLNITSFLLFLCFALIGAHSTLAQKNKTLSETDAKLINEAVKSTLMRFGYLLNNLANESLSQGDKNIMIENTQNLFFDAKNTSQIENDLDASITTSSKNPGKTSISDYLLYSFTDVVKTNSDDAVSIDNISDVTNIYDNGKGAYFVYITFYQKFKGKDKNSKPFQKVKKIADIQVIKSANEWTAKINQIYFGDHPIEPENNLKKVQISSGNRQESFQYYPASYCANMLAKGNEALKKIAYAEAYFCYSEARNTNEQTIKQAAEKGRRDVKNSMQQEGYATPEDALFNQMIDEAKEEEKKYKYKNAQNYYYYARDLNSNSYDRGISWLIEDLDRKILPAKNAEALLNKGQYNDAINAYKTILETEKNNTEAMSGLAKSYAKAGYDDSAEYYFNLVKTKDAENIGIYLWQADFYEYRDDYFQDDNVNNTKLKDDFKQAYSLYTQYMSKVKVPDPSVVAEQSFCKGVTEYYSRSYQNALDSFTSVLMINPKHYGAQIFQSKCQVKLKKYDEAQDVMKRLIKAAPDFAPAYFQMAEAIKSVPNNNKNFGRVEDNYKKAVELDNTNFCYANALGFFYNKFLYSSYKDAKYLSLALQYMDKAIAIGISNGYENRKRGALATLYYYEAEIYNMQGDYVNKADKCGKAKDLLYYKDEKGILRLPPSFPDICK